MTTQNGLWRITFDTNPDDCNLSCIMCEDHSPFSTTQRERLQARIPKHRMPIALIEKIVAQAKPLGLREIIPSTMGEPLLYKHFTDILTICHQHAIKLNLTTNGTFPIKGAKQWAALIVPVTTDVKISWNGANKTTQEKIMLKTNWEKVLNNVKEFIAVRNQYAERGGNYCRVTLQLTFLEENVNELADIIYLAIQLGVDRVKGHHLWIHFKEMAHSALQRDSHAIQRWNIAVQNAHQVAAAHLLPNGKKILLENFYLLEPKAAYMPQENDLCPFLGREAWIATDGRFNPCCAPDKERRTLGEFGNLNESSLVEIFNGAAYQQLQKTYASQQVCQKCTLRKPSKLATL